MKIVINGNTKILTCELGYLIRNKKTGDCSTEVYIGTNADVEDFEEIVDKDIIIKLCKEIERLKKKEKQWDEMLKMFTKQLVVEDEKAHKAKEFHEEWMYGEDYVAGQYVKYKAKLYKVLSDHTSQKDWRPKDTPSLYSEV